MRYIAETRLKATALAGVFVAGLAATSFAFAPAASAFPDIRTCTDRESINVPTSPPPAISWDTWTTVKNARCGVNIRIQVIWQYGSSGHCQTISPGNEATWITLGPDQYKSIANCTT